MNSNDLNLFFKHLTATFFILLFSWLPAMEDGPVRVLFLGHDKEHHNSNVYYPMLAKALGREAIYFDYVTKVEDAFDDADYLGKFDAVLLYANHEKITPQQWENLKNYVESGGGFVPVHCASACFGNEPGFDQLVGGRFAHHKTAIFKLKTLQPAHGAIKDVPGFEAWDETYVHKNHNGESRTVLQVREVGPDDNITEPEPWTWVREQGKGRVFYTASGHDERVWARDEFHQLLKRGILWAIGETRRETYQNFITERTPQKYEVRDNIANYENRPKPLEYQFPLAAKDSMDYTQVPVGWKLELFAAEPDIINPIYLAWDERGRLWVAETTDYPNEVRAEGGNDKIKILEDTDGDGKCDKVTIFADGLNIPTSLTFANGGVIVSQAPNFLFLKDTNGDDKADEKRVLFPGMWSPKDTHAGPSNLRYGFDNWIWGTVGYAGFNGEVGGVKHNFQMGPYRFKPDGSAIEFIGQFNNNTWGLGFNEQGDVFGSTANRHPSFFVGIPQSVWGEGNKGLTAKSIADHPNINPITPNIRQVDVFGGYTAASGHALATSENFPEAWRNKIAFVCEPTGRILGKFELLKVGGGYQSKNLSPLIASADEWFSPVVAEVGPDGNLWIADWYNFIIQHNPTPSIERGGYKAENGVGNAHENPNRDKQHGRIYRLVWEGAKPSPKKNLSKATTSDLVTALGDGNLFWRATAQRLLVEKADPGTTAPLQAKIKAGGVGATHALWSLQGLGQLDQSTHQLALLSSEPGLKRNAIRALRTDPASVQLFFDTAVTSDKDPLVRLAAFAKLATFPKTEITRRAASQLLKDSSNASDEWLSAALTAAGGAQEVTEEYTYGPNLLPNPSFEKLTDKKLPEGWNPQFWAGKSDAEFSVSIGIARDGSQSLQINSAQGADASWLTTLTLEPNTRYEMSAWVKTNSLKTTTPGAKGALLNVHQIRESITDSLKESTGWTQVKSEFNSGSGGKVDVNLLYGGYGKATGTAWYDEASFRKIIATRPTATEIVGEASRGKVVFETHAAAACNRCHVAGGAGGIVGPSLDGIASRKDEAYLRQSLLDPQATMAEGYTLGVSPMPPMNLLLTDQEIEDVMAYLKTLK